MENQTKLRVSVFIDGSNFYYRIKSLTLNRREHFKLLDFNYGAFFRRLIKENRLGGIRYYIGAIIRQGGINKEKSEKMYADQQKLIAKLQQQSMPVILGTMIQHQDKTFHEKGVDVRIAVEMIRFAREGVYDIAYLLSSDTDLVPAVEEVRSFGKQVIYVGTSEKQSFGLTKASNSTILLREEDIIPFIPIIHHMKLNELPFENIKKGLKKIEIRLNDEKRKLLRVGDFIEFSLVKNKSQKILSRVLELLNHPTFSELLETYQIEDFGRQSKREIVDALNNIYNKNDEKTYGVLGIRIEYLG
ncbi:MAG: NYN domain-containing protein [Patescibacteria group bacterium]